MKLPSTLCVLFLANYCNASSEQLADRTFDGDLLSSLECELQWALSNFNVQTACKAFFYRTNSMMSLWEFLEDAIREGYRHVLFCAQSGPFSEWETPSMYHQFYALAYGQDWFQEELWGWAKFDWERYFKELLSADNVEFFKHARDMGLAPLALFEKAASSRDRLENLGAAKIMSFLGMEIRSDSLWLERYIRRGQVNMLRELHSNNIDILRYPWNVSGFRHADILDFGLSLKPDIVDIQMIAQYAAEGGDMGLLKVLHRRCGTFPLDQEHLTVAARDGFLDVILWAHSINPNLRPTKECLPQIIIKGYVDMFKFLNFHDKEFLPEPYHEEKADRETMWHYTMVVVLYSIDPELVPLELLYRHAMRLCRQKLTIWTNGKIQKDMGKTILPTGEDLERAIGKCAWSLARWIIEGQPTLCPSGGAIRNWMEDNIRIYNTSQSRIKFLMFLRYLYSLRPTREYLPTAGELQNLPVEYVQWVYDQDTDYLSNTDLIELCSAKRTGFDLHEWVYDIMKIEFDYFEMANKAARVGNVDALKWITMRDSSVFPSKESIVFGLKGRNNTIQLLKWVFSTRPDHLPDWNCLKRFFGQTPELMEQIKDYQEGSRYLL
jgi:hypothetical protein